MNNNINIIALVALGLIATVCAVFLKETKLKTTALLVTTAAGALIFLRLLPALSSIWQSFSALADSAGVNVAYLQLLLKIIAIAYLAEFSAQLCRDAGEGAVGLKIEFGAKLAILLLSLPVIATVVTSVLDLLS